MKKITLILIVWLFAGSAIAATNTELEARLDALAAANARLEARVNELEKQNSELVTKQNNPAASQAADTLGKSISISGLVEVEASLQGNKYHGGNSDSSSDLILATAQLGLGATLNDNLSADLVLLYKEGENSDHVIVDEATINYTIDTFTGRVGKLVVSFGNFNSHLISDPLTLALGETQETALQIGYGHNFGAITGYIFNGKAEKTGDEDHLRDFGLSLTLTPHENIEVGISYLSDLADSNAELSNSYSEQVGGISSYAILNLGPVELSGELLTALEEFATADLDADGNGQGDQPLAWNAELSGAILENLEMALRVEGSEDFNEQPELQYGAGLSWAVRDNLSLSLEYLRGNFDRNFAPVDGSGNRQSKRDLLTTQLALEF